MKKSISLIAAMLCCIIIFAGCSPKDEALSITTAKAKTESSISDNSYSGMLEAFETREIYPNVPGKVTVLNVEVGTRVKKGDVLFRLDDTDARLTLAQAKANYNSTALTPARVNYDEAKTNYDRMLSLYNEGAISKSQYEAAKAKLTTAQAQMESSRSSAAAALAIANNGFSDMVITAPISGEVSQKNIEIGSLASAQTPALTIIDQSKLQIKVGLTEQNVGEVTLNMPVEVTLRANGDLFEGSVSAIAPAGDPKTAMFEVTVMVDNSKNKLKSGMSATVKFNAGEAVSALLIPKEALVKEGEKTFVYVVSKNALEKREIEIGEQRNAYIQIKSGLSAGEEVVVGGSGQVTEKTSFRIVSSLQ